LPHTKFDKTAVIDHFLLLVLLIISRVTGHNPVIFSTYAKHLFSNLIVHFAAVVAEYITVELAIPTQPGTVTLMSVFGWITIFQRVDDTFDWDRPWAQYKAGFGSIDDNFWLGLENGHREEKPTNDNNNYNKNLKQKQPKVQNAMSRQRIAYKTF